MKEKWKKFRDSSYEVSNRGRVRNKFGKIMKACEPKHFKYRSYVLQINGSQKTVFEHRLVAECFVKNRKEKKQVNHIDGNKNNNSADNLQWVTQGENNKHAYDMGLKKYRPLHYKGKFGSEHNRSKSVMCVQTNEIFGSMSEASRKLNIHVSSVSWSIKYDKPIYGMKFMILN